MINNKSEIINKLFFNELKNLIDKYNNIDDKTVEVIESIFTDIEDNAIKEYLISNSDKLAEIVDDYKVLNEIDIDKIIFFSWYNLNIETISIHRIKEYYKELTSSNYVEFENYIVYTNEKDLREYAREELDCMLENEYHIDRLLDKDTLIDMWLNNTGKEEILEEILMNDDIEDILELDSEYAFTLNSGIEYRYSEKGEQI